MWLLDALYKKRNSDKIAVIHRNEALSYRELWSRSEIIAGFLQQEGLYPDAEKTPIVIYGNKENDIIPVMHAALKLGVPYVPVDTTWGGIGNSNWYITCIICCYLFSYICARVTGKKTDKAAFLVLMGSLCLNYMLVLSKYRPWYCFDTILCYPLGMMFSVYKEKIIEKSLIV